LQATKNMIDKNFSQSFSLEPNDEERLSILAGSLNKHFHQIEQFFGVTINNRGNIFEIIGIPKCAGKAIKAIKQLYQETEKKALTPKQVMLTLKSLDQDYNPSVDNKKLESATIVLRETTIKPRTRNQQHFIKSMQQYDINFGIGPAGTGKTFLAIACAISALEKETVSRIVLTRPAVEAGENLGFLPGGIEQKIDPYLRPLYDALYQLVGSEKIKRLIEKGIIEIAPLAFMRGRTLNDSFVIMDEAQNSTKEQMKMFLTRIGFGSKSIIVGDITQVDLPRNKQTGLRHCIHIFKNITPIQFTFFTAQDVVRHPLVQQIIEAYNSQED
jgi:phosphate starvation-inducible protein PhoH and related proteins